MKEIAVLFNPSSNNGKSEKKIEYLRKELKKNDIKSKIYISKTFNEFKELSKKLSKDYSVLGIAGGDSSYSIAVDCMFKDSSLKKFPVFSFFPTGSSNDIAREFGIYDIKDAVKALKNNKTTATDVGFVKGENYKTIYFLGQTNIGLGVEVNKLVERLKKSKFPLKNQNILGFYSVVKTYKSNQVSKSLKIILKNNEEIEGDFLISLFSNIKYWATGKKLFPFSSINDGKVKLFALRRVGLFKLLDLNRKVKNQKHLKDENILLKSAEKVKIISDKDFNLQVDGEIIAEKGNPVSFNKIEISKIKSAIKVLSLL